MWPSDTKVCPLGRSCPTASTSTERGSVARSRGPTRSCMRALCSFPFLFRLGSHGQCLPLGTTAYSKMHSQTSTVLLEPNSVLKCWSDVTKNRHPTRGARKTGLFSGASRLEEPLTVMFRHVSPSPVLPFPLPEAECVTDREEGRSLPQLCVSRPHHSRRWSGHSW